MRIVYGVMGYGRGHATRTATVLPELMRRHDVLVLAGGDAYETLSPLYPDAVMRIPTLGYVYGRRGKRSKFLTLKQNMPAILDIFLRGPTLDMVISVIREFRASVIISDAEAWTHRAGNRLGIPRIAFDHFGILTHCKPRLSPGDRWRAELDRFAYLRLMGQPQRVIVSSFYDAPPRRPGVRIVGPLLRDEVLRQKATEGDYLLVYFNNGPHQFTDSVEEALRQLDCPVKVYGTQRIHPVGKIEFCPPSNVPFLEDLAGCRAVISTAGNQLVGEAVHLGKPMLVMPEACVEQRCNANAIERLGIGIQVDLSHFGAAVARRFLARHSEFVDNINRAKRDGRSEALDALESDLKDLAGAQRQPDYIRKVS
jgi:uncharacterized protein (TIGR00661 family)